MIRRWWAAFCAWVEGEGWVVCEFCSGLGVSWDAIRGNHLCDNCGGRGEVRQ